VGLVLLAALLSGAYSFWTVRGRSGRTRATYVGSTSCRDCHAGEAASFVGSGHGRTLRVAGKTPLAKALDGRVAPDPETPGVRWSYRLDGAELKVERVAAAGEVERFVLDYAFGSDHHATTFVSLHAGPEGAAVEHRLTHYPDDDALAVTPGQTSAKPYPGTTPYGRTMPEWETRACFRCHSTRISAEGSEALSTVDLIPNVTCERCHGPASAHVAAARAGKRTLTMPFGLHRWTPETQMALCGKCHRHPSEALPGRIRRELAGLARFQPLGLMQSACYQASGGAITCVTCHDPHARTDSDRARYDAVCLKCHGLPDQTACPVSALADCLSCHMPRVDSGQRVRFTDHWIRVRTPADPPAAADLRSKRAG
jgi:hypothetical protein